MKIRLTPLCCALFFVLTIFASPAAWAQPVFQNGMLLQEPLTQAEPGHTGRSWYRVAQGPRAIGAVSWDPRVIVSVEEREVIRQTPIELRSNRPFHFYGNSVRRFRRIFSR